MIDKLIDGYNSKEMPENVIKKKVNLAGAITIISRYYALLINIGMTHKQAIEEIRRTGYNI